VSFPDHFTDVSTKPGNEANTILSLGSKQQTFGREDLATRNLTLYITLGLRIPDVREALVLQETNIGGEDLDWV